MRWCWNGSVPRWSGSVWAAGSDQAPKIGLRTETTAYPLAEANRALDDLRHGRFEGAAVLRP
ncbi:hypothetical protein [Paracoccus marinaquae]|uniref:Alcohol dehydrogenase n=1 Tax=Paracoccus marinaquae TaxID=2841926 RepID=A0ABS6ANH7_9RHOB|nr:hypothetical protein [Paracoccus marinaquae]MBU3031402.1 hypothetical protein [Paracoccus marinaquae]